MNKKACILGATGLVGGEFLSLLLHDEYYAHITIIVRKKIAIPSQKVAVIVADFANLEDASEAFQVDDVFCCLGTTMKKAGSKEAFKQVDYEYVLKAAAIAHKQGAQQFLVISAVGANPHAYAFYNRIKGLMEKDVSSIPLQAIHIFRPSLLVGKRQEKRLLEDIAQLFAKPMQFLLKGSFAKYAPVEARTVAEAMAGAAKLNTKGVHIHEAL
jgi:uncharacterized protein YbjT (DUF2867 family)